MLRNYLAGALCAVLCAGVLQPLRLCAQTSVGASDTLSYTLAEAEKTFLEKNLSLMAQHYDIDANKALIDQARLWDNPILNTDQNVHSNNRWFEHSKNPDGSYNGQYFVQVEQLIRTAGKRGKLMNLATTNAAIAEAQFRDVLRSLKLQLREDFYTIQQLQGNQRLYAQQMEQLGKLLLGMDAQFKAGNIARKDYLRIQALHVSTTQEAVQNLQALMDREAELKTLLQITGAVFVQPVADEQDVVRAPGQNLEQIVTTARENNPELQTQVLQAQYQRQNLSYQKSLAVPDVTLGPSFDKNSNYIQNYVGMGVSLPLPLVNRNQGNIRSARFQVKEEETRQEQTDQQLQNQIRAAYEKLIALVQLNNQDQQDFYSNYNQLYNNIVESYRQRQIGLIEFIDYFDAYEDIREKQLQQQLNLQLAREQLNFLAGTDVVR